MKKNEKNAEKIKEKIMKKKKLEEMKNALVVLEKNLNIVMEIFKFKFF